MAEKNQKEYTISELSKEFDITTRTIRFYEDERLLSPKRQGQRRIYNEGDRVQIKLILRGKRLGLSIKEIKETLSLYDPKSGNKKQLNLLLNILKQKRAVFEQQLQDIQCILVELNGVEQSLLDALHEINTTK